MNSHWHSVWKDGVIPGKLHEIADRPAQYVNLAFLTRRAQVVFSRLRLGHTRLTHDHLLERKPPPMCTHCSVVLTVRHVILECGSYDRLRSRCNLSSSLREALSDDPVHVKNLGIWIPQIFYNWFKPILIRVVGHSSSEWHVKRRSKVKKFSFFFIFFIFV